MSERALRQSWFFWFIAGFTLLQLAWLAVLSWDFVTHLSAPDITTGSVAIRLMAGCVLLPLGLLVSALVLKHAPTNVVGLFLTLWTVTVMSDTLRADAVLTVYDPTINVGWFGLWGLGYFFPDGRPFPQRFEGAFRALFVLLIASWLFGLLSAATLSTVNTYGVTVTAANVLFIPALLPLHAFLGPLTNALILVLILPVLPSIVLRYRASSTRERLQIKWLVWSFGVLAALLAVTALIFGRAFLDNYTARYGTPGALVQLLTGLYMSLFPFVAVGNAVLRHRLYDIDLIIRRTLIYSILTVLLALVYFGSVILLQTAVRGLTGQDQPELLTVLSTLLIAALFVPLRRRVQDTIDQRFYRRKFDARQALAGFATSARSETDLQTLTHDVLALIDGTVAPQQASLWLNPAAQFTPRVAEARPGLESQRAPGNEQMASARLAPTAQSAKTAAADRQWDRGARVAGAYSLLIFLIFLGYHVGVWLAPSDGWLWTGPNPGGDSAAPVTLVARLADVPSGLQAGDRVLAIEGKPLREQFNEGLWWYRQAAPAWRNGQVLAYSIERAGLTLRESVAVRRLSIAEHLLAGLRTASNRVANPAAALLELACSWGFFAVSVFVFLRRPRERAAHALMILGAAFLFQKLYFLLSLPSVFYPQTWILATLFQGWLWAILPSLLYLTLVFPEPKWPARRFPLATVLTVYGCAISVPVLPYVLNLGSTAGYFASSWVLGMASFAYVVLPLAAIAHTLATTRDPLRRAQAGWLAVGVIGFIAGGLAYAVWANDRMSLAGSLVQNGGYLVLPVCLAVAILRHRLFDIEVIIRRTLVYSVLTATLALVYFGSVLVLQTMMRVMTGQAQSPAMIVVSTLLIAVLVVPLRRGVQDLIDRRFYRRKYNAERVVARFGATTRGEVDLDQLTAQLLATVEGSMQPEYASLWLRTPAGR